jgi:hypothetical protein
VYAEFGWFLEPVKRMLIGSFMIVPRSDTGIHAEKAMVCWENPVQGTRQISGVRSQEAMPVVLNRASA